jgi:glycosyltransferase involved in cell wall biosynthesis
LRVGVITSQFPPRWGGVGNGIHRQVLALAARGHEVDVVTRRRDRGMEFPPLPENVHMHEVGMLKLPMLFTTSFARHAVKRLLGLGKGFDVVHSHSNMSLLERRHYFDIPCPIVSTMHGTWRGERSTIGWRDVTLSVESVNDLAVLYLSPLFDKYEDYALRYSNAALVECDLEMAAVAKRGVENYYDRIVKLPAGIDTDAFRPENADPEVVRAAGADPDAPLVLFVGRLAARKGALDALGMFARAHAGSPEAHMVFVGGGPQGRALRGQIQRLGLRDRVHLLGKQPFEQLCALYASSDVVVFPSFWEGQGLVPGEAMASGTPCVAAEVGWVPEIIEQGVNGFHYPPRDIARGAELLAKALEDDALRDSMGRRARQDVLDRWDWKHHMEKLERLYEDVQGDQKPPRGD